MGRARFTAFAALVALAAIRSSYAQAEPREATFQAAIAALDGDHDAAIGAVRVLRDGGAGAATALADRWHGLSPTAKRRAIPALERLARRHDAAVACLVDAARSADDALRADALEALARSGSRGLDDLEALLTNHAAGPRAASSLARTDPDGAVSILLRWFETQGPDLPPEGRQALTRSVKGAQRPVEPSFRRWLVTEPSADALAQAALALSPIPSMQALQARLIETAIEGTHEFPTDWRLVVASAASGSSERIDAWLVGKSREPEPWMLRAKAIESLGARGRAAAVSSALEDPYPRVRIAAAHVLANDSATMTKRAALARRDVWPMVRAGAIESLRDDSKALPVIVAAVDDPMSDVRAAAIAVLVDAPDATGWDRVHRRLRNQDEWPSVVAASLDYVRAHCRRDAVEALYYVVKRAASPSARTDDVANAARAVETLRVLGTPDAQAIVAQLEAAETLPQPLETALKRELSEPLGCASPAP